MWQKLTIAGLGVISLVAVTLALTAGEQLATNSDTQIQFTPVAKAELLEEFNNAYLETITPTGITHEIDLVATESVTELVPGAETITWSYNGITPAEEIRIKLGDELKLNFTNNLTQATSIHFHGIRVPNDMDGVPELTQPLIEPGEQFIYQFTPKDAGTYWYHPHFESAEQIERGLYGVIVVEEPEPLAYQQDVAWVLDDWLLQNDYQIYPEFMTAHDLMHDGRWGNLVTVNSNIAETLEVRPGERLRLRLVNTANGRVFGLDFGDLAAMAIAVDGLTVGEAFDPNGYELAPGNRIDLDITIPADATGQEFTVYDRFTRSVIPLAKVSVQGEPIATPQFAFPVNPNIPNWNAVGNTPDLVYELDSEGGGHSMRGGMMNTKWAINGKLYPDAVADKLKQGDFIKVQFKNSSSRLHPMHIHGQFFKVIARDGKPVDEPYFRDTVLVHPKETVDVGMITIDGGDWLNHCHILEHAESGMMTVIEVE